MELDGVFSGWKECHFCFYNHHYRHRGMGGRQCTTHEKGKMRGKSSSSTHLWLFQARIDAGLEVTQIAEHALFEFFEVADWATKCLWERA